ncbi:TPA: hypothetical protein ACPUGD_005508, partial [Klebsiella pneumoniae]
MISLSPPTICNSAAKIIKTARYVIMKLSENYPYKGVYEKCLV